MKRLVLLGALALTATACGGGTGTGVPTIPPAHVYQLVGFQPSGAVTAGKPVTVSFTIEQPDGTPLTKFKRGSGPHTGVHLIFVRDDLSTIIHHHPPLNGTGKIVDSVTFPAPGPYRLVIDVYPASCGGSSTPAIPGAPTSTCNFQLFDKVRVAGTYKPQPLPPTTQAETVDGYHFTLSRRRPSAGDPGPARAGARDRSPGPGAHVRDVVRRARTRDLLPPPSRSTTSTRTCVRLGPSAARASSARRRSPAARPPRAN